MTSFFLGLLLMGTSVLYVLTMNLRSRPNTERMWEGHDDYLGKVDSTAKSDSPNVLVILMDDMGWGDISAQRARFMTPRTLTASGRNGLNLENFYPPTPFAPPRASPP